MKNTLVILGAATTLALFPKIGIVLWLLALGYAIGPYSLPPD